jgi:hypothetical protein
MAQPPSETTLRRPRRARLRSSLIALLATLIGLSLAVAVLRPEDEPVASNVSGGAILPGTDARVRIDVQPVGGSDFFEEIKTTARLDSLNPDFEKRLRAFGKCGLQVEIVQGWTPAESKDTSMAVNPTIFINGAAEECGRAVGNAKVELTEQVPPFTKTAHYWYPFDHLTYRVRAETRVLQYNANGWPGDASDWRFATAELHFTAPGWRVTQRESRASRMPTVTPLPGGGQSIRWQPGAAVVEAELTRPLAVQLSVVLFLLVLVAVVVSITQVETLGDSLQVAIALSVLLWTSREALVPGSPKLFLAIDAIFLGLALLVLGTILIVGWRHGGKLGAPRDKQEAPASPSVDPHSVFVLLDGSPVFHRESCPRLKEIPADRQQRVNAMPQGRRPCRVCGSSNLHRPPPRARRAADS